MGSTLKAIRSLYFELIRILHTYLSETISLFFWEEGGGGGWGAEGGVIRHNLYATEKNNIEIYIDLEFTKGGVFAKLNRLNELKPMFHGLLDWQFSSHISTKIPFSRYNLTIVHLA